MMKTALLSTLITSFHVVDGTRIAARNVMQQYALTPEMGIASHRDAIGMLKLAKWKGTEAVEKSEKEKWAALNVDIVEEEVKDVTFETVRGIEEWPKTFDEWIAEFRSLMRVQDADNSGAPADVDSSCKKAALTEDEKEFLIALYKLEKNPKVKVITSNCGFFERYTKLVKLFAGANVLHTPVLLSSLDVVPALLEQPGYSPLFRHARKDTDDGEILVVSAAGNDLQKAEILPKNERVTILGADDDYSFTTLGQLAMKVESGAEEDVEEVSAALVKAVKERIEERKQDSKRTVKYLVLECTLLWKYAADLAKATELPVYTQVSLVSALLDAQRSIASNGQVVKTSNFLDKVKMEAKRGRHWGGVVA